MRFLILVCLAGVGALQANEADLQRAFNGKPAVLKIDMPGTHHGVDLHLERDEPMDWRQYSQRLKSFGVAIHKGRTATVTSLVVKKDLIEIHLDGGGFGTFGDDTSTTVSTYVPKSRYENDLERALRTETDPARRRRLQSDLNLERSRRNREESRLRVAAEAASAIKRQEVQDKRLRGGSRFNLRNVPAASEVSPRQVAEWLRDYVEFGGGVSTGPAGGRTSSATPAGIAPILRRGMPMEEVREKLGGGKLLSESVGTDGILTQQWEFVTSEQRFSVTAVEGLVVRYSMTSR